jgi:hypothetical protein
MSEETRKAVNFHMQATQTNVEAVCKNCGQKIIRWTLPQMGVFKDEEAWYHVCVDPDRLKHVRFHTPNDSETDKCYSPEPKEVSK